MRLTIIPSDKVAVVDGEALHGLNFTLPNIRAVQWYDDHGEVEYTDGKPNKTINDISPYQSIIDLYNTEKAQIAADAVQAAKLTWDKIKTVRNEGLEVSDYTQLLDAPISNAKQAQWAAYRQQLRAVPQTHGAVNLDNYADVAAFKAAKFPTKPLP